MPSMTASRQEMDELTREVMGLSNTVSKGMPSLTTIRQEKVELAKLDRCSNNAKLRLLQSKISYIMN
jgi:hypothetical protein